MNWHRVWMGSAGGIKMLTRKKEIAARKPPVPRKENIWKTDGESLVSRVQYSGEIQNDVRQVVDLIGGWSRLIKPGDAVTLVPNFNSEDPYPATTDLGFLRTTIDLLREAGATRLIIAVSSGLPWLPTSRVARRVGLRNMAHEMGVELLILDEDEFYEVPVPGDYLKSVSIPRAVYEAQKLVYLPCMKTHYQGGFTMSIKLPMTFPHPRDRVAIHLSHLQEKFPEISLAVQPDLIIMDGRMGFIPGGPDRGRLAEPGIFMASGDMVAIDVEGLGILQRYSADNQIYGRNPWDLAPVKIAAGHQLGSRSPAEYRVIEPEPPL